VTTNSLNVDKKKCHEPTSTTKRRFAPLAIQRNFPPTMPTQPSTTSPNDDPMHIDKTRFKFSWSKRNNVDIQIIFVFIVENRVMLLVNDNIS